MHAKFSFVGTLGTRKNRFHRNSHVHSTHHCRPHQGKKPHRLKQQRTRLGECEIERRGVCLQPSHGSHEIENSDIWIQSTSPFSRFLETWWNMGNENLLFWNMHRWVRWVMGGARGSTHVPRPMLCRWKELTHRWPSWNTHFGSDQLVHEFVCSCLSQTKFAEKFQSIPYLQSLSWGQTDSTRANCSRCIKAYYSGTIAEPPHRPGKLSSSMRQEVC